jgi:hypothetical protein
MMADPSNNCPQNARLDENDPVWRLLGKSSLPEPDGWFAARTLARCRNEGVSTHWPLQVWRWAVGGGLAVCLAIALVFSQVHSEKVDQQKDVQDAFEIMASIDTDQDSSSSPWQDTSL